MNALRLFLCSSSVDSINGVVVKYVCDKYRKGSADMNHTVTEMPCKSGKNNIYGVLYMPLDPPEKMPVVILSHGYNSCCAHVADLASHLAEKGFAVYCYDFCGGSTLSKSEGRTTDMSISSEISDLKSVIAMLSECSFADKDRLFLYGESQGGFVSALTAAEMGEGIAGIVLLYPAFCIPDTWLPKKAEEMTESFDFMGMMISRAFREGLPEYDVFEAVSNFTNPVLLLHGDNDTLVDISYSERLKAAFPNCELHIFVGEGHGFSASARKQMRIMTAEFLERLAF